MPLPQRFLATLFLVLVATSICPTALADRILWVDDDTQAEAPDGSAAAPFRTIKAAMKGARPGDTVTVRAGVYRETFRIPSGKPGKPITLRAAEGERAVLTGCAGIEGWQATSDGVWVTTLDFKPERLLVRGKRQPIARQPNEGWWASTEVDGRTLVDAAHLKGLDAAPTGGEVRVWLSRGNVFSTFPLESLDTKLGRVTVAPARPGQQPALSDGDKYYLQNRAHFIDHSGEWAVEPHGERFRLFFKPARDEDLKHVEAPFQYGSLINVRDAKHVCIEGLEIAGSTRMGIEVQGAEDVEIRRCIVYQNDYTGISLRDVTGAVVAQNIVFRNGYGISVGTCRRVTVEQNDVGHNDVDGLLVTWKSDDVTVRRNYLHHHLLWGHPDNLQLYRGVTNVRFHDNLLLAAGQSVMMEETRDGEFVGNMLVGSAAYMLIFGHSNAGHYKVHGNTLAFSGYGCMNLTWEDYDVRENVMMTGHPSFLFGVRGVEGYSADRNVFFNSARYEKVGVIATDKGWHRDFAAVQQATGQDEHSVYADPKFRNAPIAFSVLDHRRLQDGTRGTWYLGRGADGFRTGDYVEVNFDGVRRRITGVDGAAITVEPPLAEKPIKGWIVANWGDNPDFRLDLRLEPDSPGARLSESGGPVGSQIDVQAYQSGDFAGDGRRDLPELPPELRE